MKKYLLTITLLTIFQTSYSQKVVKVQDGDTYELDNGEKIRMIGINAPELHNPKIPTQPFAKESQQYLENLILNKNITLVKDSLTKIDRDKWGRLLRYTFLDGTDIHKKMISEGFADAYLDYQFTKQNEYVLEESQAKNQNKGKYNTNQKLTKTDTTTILNNKTDLKPKTQSQNMEYLLPILLAIIVLSTIGYFIYRHFSKPSTLADKPIPEPIKVIESYSLNNEMLQEYETFGRNSATQKLADTGSLNGELDTVYSKYQDFTNTNKDNRISSLEQMNKNMNSQNNRIEGEIERYKLSKEQAEQNLDESKQNRNKLISEGADTGFDLWIKMGLLTVVCLGLLAFLYSIYTTAFYEVFFGKGSKNLLTGFDFSNLDELGNMSKISVISFPLMFIAIAVLIDTFIKSGKYVYIFLLGMVTFIVDFILALMNAKKSYDTEFLNGITTTEFTMNYWSSNLYFWIFIFTATAGYIIWGVVFHNLMVMAKSIQQPELVKEQLKEIDEKIIELQERKIEFSQKIRTSELEKENNIKQIKDNEHNLALIRNGAVVVIWSELLGLVGKFMSGWNNFVKFYYTDETKSKTIIENSERIKNNWLTAKENSKQFNSFK